MSKINEILEGWGNVLKDKFNNLDPEIKTLSQYRLDICHPCELRVNNKCHPNKVSHHIKTGKMVRGCGCGLTAKTMSTESSCPMGKW